MGLDPVHPVLAERRGYPEQGEAVRIRAVAGGGLSAEDVFVEHRQLVVLRLFSPQFHLSQIVIRKLPFFNFSMLRDLPAEKYIVENKYY